MKHFIALSAFTLGLFSAAQAQTDATKQETVKVADQLQSNRTEAPVAAEEPQTGARQEPVKQEPVKKDDKKEQPAAKPAPAPAPAATQTESKSTSNSKMAITEQGVNKNKKKKSAAAANTAPPPPPAEKK